MFDDETAPTPSPWKYEKRPSDGANDRHEILWDGRPPKPNSYASFLGVMYRAADTRLVAAAPDLLAALKLFDTGCFIGDPQEHCQCHGCIARAAITKAEHGADEKTLQRWKQEREALDARAKLERQLRRLHSVDVRRVP